MSLLTNTRTDPCYPLLSVRSLSVDFPQRFSAFQAVKSLSFDAHAGKTLAIVGESGSGKSVTSRATMRLTFYSGGRISGGEIAMIFQDPMTSLDPVFSIGDQINEAMLLHQRTSSSRSPTTYCSKAA
ncbi:ATP-binding cassette domain-containing protein [Rhizobium calliandrae]|uniref:ATP-binding cassette domain-containing protein n=1 Tax=Rhizobium calliandrae TaxID=1312182 RepID=UPI0032E4EE8C